MSELAQQGLDAWNSHDGGKVAGLMADDVTFEGYASVPPSALTDRSAVEEHVAACDRFAKNFKFAPVSAQQCQGWYAHECELTGTNTGAGLGLPATKNPYRLRGVSLGPYHDANGKIKEERSYFNGADFLKQLDLTPTPET